MQGSEPLNTATPFGRQTATNQQDMYLSAGYKGYGAPVYYNFDPSGQPVVTQEKNELYAY